MQIEKDNIYKSHRLNEGILDNKWIELYCKGDWESCVCCQMEEKGRFHPDNMLPDDTLDETLH